MFIDESQCSTPHPDAQLQPTTRTRLIELGQAKLQLRRYREKVLGSYKAQAVARLIDALQQLEAAEWTEVAR